MAVTRIAIVLGELLDEGQKSSLVKDVIQGLSTCPPDFLLKIQSHLDKLTSNQQCSSECIFSYKEEDFEFLTLCRPSSSGITSLLTNFLQPPKNSDVTLNVILIYAGLLSEGSAHWLLPNFVLTPTFLTDFIQHLSTLHPKPDDTESLSSHKPIRLHIGIGAVSSGGDWRHLVSNPPQPIGGHVFQVTVNRCRTVAKPKTNKPTDPSSPSSSFDFESFLCDMLTKLPDPYCIPLSQTLVMRSPTDLTLKVSKPCIYVFPEGSGQVSILALPFYNMLIDGGCSHKPCFWSVANYLDRLDSVLVTHWGIDNILGLKTILPTVFRPSNDQSLLCLLTPPPNINNMKINNHTQDPLPFTINLPMYFSNLVGEIKRSGTNLMVYPVTRGGKQSVVPKPLQLFQKVGQGCLELFPLTPGDDDSAELRKLNDDWSKCAPSLMATSVPLNKSSGNKTTVPLLSYTSVSALVVWRPTKDTEPILRFLFVSPNAHQTRILLSLDALITSFIYLRHPKAVPAEFERKRPSQPSSAASRRPTVPVSHATSGSNEGSINSVGQNNNTTASRPSHVAKKGTTTKTTQDTAAHRPPSSKTPASSKTQANAKPPVNKTNHVVKNTDVIVESPSKQPEVHDNEVSTPNLIPSELITESSDIHDVSNNIINGDMMHKTNGFTHDLSDFEPSVNSEQTNHDLLIHDVNSMKLQDYGENVFIAADNLNNNNTDTSVNNNNNNNLKDCNQMKSTGLDEYDPIASWGSPQNLPLPPTGSEVGKKPETVVTTNGEKKPASHLTRRVTSVNSSSGSTALGATKTGRLSLAPRVGGIHSNISNQSVSYPPGYTIASGHAPGTAKAPPYDKVKPIYVDVAFLPGSGNSNYVDAEWFKRVRARYYVATDVRPTCSLLESLVVGKESWGGDDAQLDVSLILAYETEELLVWLGVNAGRLNNCHVNVAAVISRSSIQILNEKASAVGDGPLNYPGYRIDLF